jgi:hypothetical protein
MNVLPKENLSGKVEIDKEFLQSSDWVTAKTAVDVEAARRVIARLWPDKKTEALRQLLFNAGDTAIVSQPSTSRYNVISVTFAEMLAKEINAEHFPGEAFYAASHSCEVKNIPRLQRSFHFRDYALIDQSALQGKLAGKTIVIADDLLTTGGSVKDFIWTLNRDGVQVRSVVALAGDVRLFVDDKTRQTLENALHEKGMILPCDDLADRLTRTEARGIIFLINNVRTENATRKLAGKLQGILDRRIAPDLERDPQQTRHQGPQGEDTGDGPAAQGIPPRDIFENRQQRYVSGLQIESLQVLPDDLVSVKAIWKAEIDKLLVPIKAKAARSEEKIKAMLIRHDDQMGKHEKAKPKAPSSPLARLSQGKYNKRLTAWQDAQDCLIRREAQLRRRLKWVQEYVRDPISDFYESGAQRLAANRLAKEQPGLVRKLERARERELKQRFEQITVEFEQQERVQSQHRGRHR